MSTIKLGRYQQKVRLGLVPFRYDSDSKDFKRGAWKNWERIIGFGPDRNKAGFENARITVTRNDADILRKQREAR